MDNENAIELRHLRKSFGSVNAVGPVDVSIRKGEFFSLLGPSGCGKTTTLRLIAGLEAPSDGDIVLDGRVVTKVATHRRGLGMVFQSYALFPHRTVAQNVAFGLRVRGVDKATMEMAVGEALDRVDLAGLEDRYPSQISGGQQQRVALARAIVYKPSVLLFDEPLSNLDAKLRESMRAQIRNLTKSLGVTAVYVTHDQDEALALSDRIAILNKGMIAQIGGPMEIYGQPKSEFVADFIGSANLLKAKIQQGANGTASAVTSSGVQLQIELPKHLSKRKKAETEAMLLVRPERIRLHGEKPSADNALRGKVTDITYLGSCSKYALAVSQDLVMTVVTERMLPGSTVGDTLWLSISKDEITIIGGDDSHVRH